MKPFLVRLWHGKSPDFDKSFFAEKIAKICRKSPDGNFFYDGNLMEWTDAWRDKFLYYPADVKEAPFISGTIWVTPHGSWGAR